MCAPVYPQSSFYPQCCLLRVLYPLPSTTQASTTPLLHYPGLYYSTTQSSTSPLLHYPLVPRLPSQSLHADASRSSGFIREPPSTGPERGAVKGTFGCSDFGSRRHQMDREKIELQIGVNPLSWCHCILFAQRETLNR